jgi:hypothetical protein
VPQGQSIQVFQPEGLEFMVPGRELFGATTLESVVIPARNP